MMFWSCLELKNKEKEKEFVLECKFLQIIALTNKYNSSFLASQYMKASLVKNISFFSPSKVQIEISIKT